MFDCLFDCLVEGALLLLSLARAVFAFIRVSALAARDHEVLVLELPWCQERAKVFIEEVLLLLLLGLLQLHQLVFSHHNLFFLSASFGRLNRELEINKHTHTHTQR